MANTLPDTDRGLLTAGNSAVVFIDHQPQMAFGVASGIDRQLLLNNVVLLARGAKLFGVPAILTTVETESFSGPMWPQLLDEQIEPIVNLPRGQADGRRQTAD
jgi:nicotinamidase-related amidase